MKNENIDREVYFIENDNIEILPYSEIVRDGVDYVWSQRFRISETENEDEPGFEVYKYDWHQKPKHRTLKVFESETEAEDFLFEILEAEFLSYDNRVYPYEFFEDALESYSEINNIDFEVAESIFKHKKCLEKIQKIQAENEFIAQEKFKKEVEIKAKEYSKLIPKLNESYKDTCNRLSNVLEKRIHSTIFHKTVKLIRA